MNILLDTSAFLLMTTEPNKVPKRVNILWQDAGNTLFLSSISANEIALKYQKGKLLLPSLPSVFIPTERIANSVMSLPLNEESCVRLESLPSLHKDPFDRLLICQAHEHDLTILTNDMFIRQYKVKTLW